MTSPSGEQHRIAAAGYRAVLTEAGAGLRRLAYDGRDLIAGFDADQMCSGGRGQVLVPWPNRIRDGAYAFDGANLRLPLTEPARHNASHGLVRWASWRRLDGDDASVRLGLRLLAQPGYPWMLDLTLRYALSMDGLAVSLTATNRSATAAPFAVGFHPYLTTGSTTVDADRLTLPGDRRLLTDPDRKLPTGMADVAGTAYDFRAGRPIGDLVLDDAFHRAGAGPVTLRSPEGPGVELWADDRFGWFQAYTADDQPAAARRALAVEPMTAPPDAFNSGTDLIRLDPGGSCTLAWGIRALV